MAPANGIEPISNQHPNIESRIAKQILDYLGVEGLVAALNANPPLRLQFLRESFAQMTKEEIQELQSEFLSRNRSTEKNE